MTVRGEMAGVVRVRERENCNSRHFSRLMKSCCPNPNAPSHSYIYPNPIIVKPKHHSAAAAFKTSISCLPDDVLCEILARVPLSSLPTVSAVCRRWNHLLDSPSFSFLRRGRGLIHPTLYAFSLGETTSFCSIRLFVDDYWYFSGNDGVSLPDIPVDVSHARLTAVGRKVYVISRFSCFLFDPWTGSFKSRSGPLFPRKRFAVAAVNGKIYVAGGSARASALEEYDPDANEWRVVCDAPRKRYGCIGVGVEGVFYVIGGLKIGGTSDTRAAVSGAEARVYASSMDLYGVAARGWLRSRAVPGGGCVVAACGANGHVYVLASHTVELSFWRFYAKRKGGSGSGVFGEWCRMRSPPLPGQVRLDGTVKFSCVGVEDKVVLIQVIGCIDDLLRRSGRNVRGYKGGLVLIFDCVTEEWSRGPDLPEYVQRAACVCVES